MAQRFHWLFNNPVFQNHRFEWLRIRDKQLPFAGEFIDRDEERQGQKRDREVVDGEAWRACLVFAGGMMSGATPQSIQWFRLQFAEEALQGDWAARTGLDARLELLNRVLNGSNFYNAAHGAFMELPFGQAPVGIFEDAFRGVRFENYPIGCYAYEVDHTGLPDCFAVRRRMTGYQLCRRFGMESLPQSVQNAVKEGGGLRQAFDVCWLVEKNADYDLNKLNSSFQEWASYYWLDKSGEGFIRVSGFRDFPVAIARYQVIGSQAYGLGPGWYADSDARMLYRVLEDAFRNAQLFVDPPLQVPADMEVDFTPGGVSRNRAQGMKAEALFALAPVFQQLFEIGEGVRDKINRAYNVNLFTMLDQEALQSGQRTAYELSLRNQERLQQLGPVTERLNTEFLSAIIERVYAILERHGVFPPFAGIDGGYQGSEIAIEYTGPLAQAQKMSGLDNMNMLLSMVANMAQFMPETFKLIDAEAFMRTFAGKTGVDAKLLKSPEAYREELEALAEQAQAAAAAEREARVAPAVESYTNAARNVMEMGQNDNPALAALLTATGGGADE
ncbi:MAG: head-tail connector protein [Acidaminococcales bacterium]|nr:head-tail connector protein [Acidaminococcales bacterium]